MRSSILLVTLALSLSALQAVAGDGNTLYLVQEQDGTLGNNFYSDQAAANYTAIGLSAAPATQKGSAHSADLRLSGDCTLISGCGVVLLNQDNTTTTLNAQIPVILSAEPRAGNTVTLSLAGTGNAGITQIGDANTATLDIRGGGDGTVKQTGLGNLASLTVAGGAGGAIAQTGNTNTATLNVLGIAQSAVALTQTGSGLVYNTGVQVVTSVPGTITITQSN